MVYQRQLARLLYPQIRVQCQSSEIFAYVCFMSIQCRSRATISYSRGIEVGSIYADRQALPETGSA
jgi:hypothetical protein